MSDRLTIRIDHDTKTRLNQLSMQRGLTLSETIRELVNRETGTDPLTIQMDELRRILAPLSGIDFYQIFYHIARSSIAPVVAVQMQNKETGDILNETVKTTAEKIVSRMIAGNGGN